MTPVFITLGCKHLKLGVKGWQGGAAGGGMGQLGWQSFGRGWGSENCLVGAVPEIFWQNKLGCLVV